jgi:hypothetical protein
VALLGEVVGAAAVVVAAVLTAMLTSAYGIHALVLSPALAWPAALALAYLLPSWTRALLRTIETRLRTKRWQC